MHSMNAKSMNQVAINGTGANGRNGVNGSAFSPIVTSSDLSLTWDEVRSRVEVDDEGKWDALIHRDKLTMHNGKLTVQTPDAADYVHVLTPTPWATSQFCGRLRIPTAYFRRCPKELQDMQFNTWVKRADVGGEYEDSEYSQGQNGSSYSYNSPSRWLLRVKDDQLRGVLSDRYSKLDNQPFLETLEPLLPSRLQAEWFALTDESMHLRLIDPTLSREVLKDDRIMVGLHISNSEVGKRSVTVDAIVWRLVCRNGLIRLVKGKSLMQQKHIALSSYAIRRNLEKAMGEALTTAAGLLEKMSQATEIPVVDVEGTIEQLGANWNLSEAFEQRIKDALLQEPAQQQENLYGLVNAVTQAAQSLSPDERYEMEAKAGTLMESGITLLPNAKARRRRSLAVPIGSPINMGASADNGIALNGNEIQARSEFAVAEHTSHITIRSNGSKPDYSGKEEFGQKQPQPRESRVFQQAQQMFGGHVVAQSHDDPRQNADAIPALPMKVVTSPQKETLADTSRFNGVRDGNSLPDTIARQRTTSGGAVIGPAKESSASVSHTFRSDEPSTTTQWELIWAIADKRSLSNWDVQYLIQEHFDKDDSGMMTKAEAQQLMQMLQQKPLAELQAPEPDEEISEEEF